MNVSIKIGILRFVIKKVNIQKYLYVKSVTCKQNGFEFFHYSNFFWPPALKTKPKFSIRFHFKCNEFIEEAHFLY